MAVPSIHEHWATTRVLLSTAILGRVAKTSNCGYDISSFLLLPQLRRVEKVRRMRMVMKKQYKKHARQDKHRFVHVSSMKTAVQLPAQVSILIARKLCTTSGCCC